MMQALSNSEISPVLHYAKVKFYNVLRMFSVLFAYIFVCLIKHQLFSCLVSLFS